MFTFQSAQYGTLIIWKLAIMAKTLVIHAYFYVLAKLSPRRDKIAKQKSSYQIPQRQSSVMWPTSE